MTDGERVELTEPTTRAPQAFPEPRTGPPANPRPAPIDPPYSVLEQAMDRSAGAPRIDGNEIRLNFDGPLTFEAWIEAIARARRFVHFENYILRDDATGRAFRDALIAKAEEGLEVRVLYDWVGCWATPRRYWKPFRDKGVEVRAFNRPAIRDPFGILQRDHRKLVCVDGEIAFVGGFCVGEEWAGAGMRPPWRDTGAEIRGPAAAAAARAFENIWNEIGAPVPDELYDDDADPIIAGETPVWLIEGVPWRTRVYRVTQLVAASARERLWITDPYFVAPRPVAEAVVAAARDGVDVRILVPAHNNWPLVGSLSRGGYRDLLKAGVRLFEWQGPMIHAKTAVADGLWSRIGSSNLNAASLLGNWEIDLGVLDRDLARQMEGLFLADLASSVEIVLPGGPVVASEGRAPAPRQSPLEPPETFAERLEHWRQSPELRGWRISDLVRVGSTLGDAIAGHRLLEREARTVLGTVASFMLGLALLAALFPKAVSWTLAVILGWLGLVAGGRAWAEARRARSEKVLREVENADE